MNVTHIRLAICAGAFAMLGILGGTAAAASGDPSYDDAVICSKWLHDHGPGEASSNRRRCVIAVASTYVNAEDNSASEDDQLFTDDISRHRPGTDPNFMPGNRAKFLHQNAHAVISAIKNRQWTIDGDVAWILYDGYLKTNPDKPAFYVAERFTLENGLIKEIIVAGVTTVAK
jgi:hypothetical protein